MNDHDERIGRWLELGPDRGPAAGFEAAMRRVGGASQRPAWLVALGGGTLGGRPLDRRVRLVALATVALMAVVAGGVLMSGGLVPSPHPSAIVPSPSPTRGTDASVPPDARPEVIVFTESKELANGEEDCTSRFGCRRSWVAVANTDGTDQHRLFPDTPGRQSVVTVSPDGLQLIAYGVGAADGQAPVAPYYLTDLHGTEPVVLDTGCERPCVADHIGAFAFSPDGFRLAFVRGKNDVPGALEETTTVIAIMELATGTVTELTSTMASNPFEPLPCGYACGEGVNDVPRWSADGRQLLFSRSSIGIPRHPRSVLDTKLFVVNADGTDLRQLVATELYARDAQWSPDGSRIAFTAAIETLTVDDFGLLEDWHQLNDIYSVNPDGSDVRRLTSFTAGPVPDLPGDVGATLPAWTADGRLVLTRRQGQAPDGDERPWEVWVMDRDGANATQVEAGDATALTSIGCIVCAYPTPDPNSYPSLGFWRPNP